MPYKTLETIAYDPAARDLSAEVRKAKATNAELAMVISRVNDAILITQEMVKQRWTPMGIVSAGPGWYEERLHDDARQDLRRRRQHGAVARPQEAAVEGAR